MPGNDKNRSRSFVAIFFFSGLAALAYQIVWAKSFAAAIGHDFPAMLAVVCAFMSGMAAGNLLVARFHRLPPTLYGWLEIVVAGWAIAITILMPAIQTIVFELLGASPTAGKHWAVVFSIVFVALFPATAAMGATFPAAERFLFTSGKQSTTALLYGANTAGAMVGALAAAFFLMPNFGLRVSVFGLAGINFCCGLGALVLARGTAAHGVTAQKSGASPKILAIQIFLAGMVGLGFEVAIIRGLAQILENTVYTFAEVLAVYLGTTALGALAYHRNFGARILKHEAGLFAALSLGSAAAGLALQWMPPLYIGLRVQLGDSLFSVALAETLITALLLAIPCFFMGALWSRLAERSLGFRPNLGWAVAVNTLGASFGPLIWGLIILPFAGLRWALALVPLLYAAMGGPHRRTLLSGVVALFAIPFLTSNARLIDGRGRILALKEGVMGSVAVVETAPDARALKFNNRLQMGGTASRFAEQRQADIPLLLHPAPKRALFIGLGTGISFATSAYYPGLVADGVELVPEIADAMTFFNDPETLGNTTLLTHIADGRRFVRTTTNQYDVIIGDLFHPAQDGVAFLYTREHFQAVRARLTQNGLFCQWLPLHQMDLGTLAIISQTFALVFSDAQQWLLRFEVETPVVGLIGWNGKTPDVADLEDRMAASTDLATHLRSVGLTDVIRLKGCFLRQIDFLSSATLNTDANPIITFRAPAITFRRKDNPAARLLSLIQSAGTPPNFPPRTQRFIDARNIYLQGAAHESEREMDLALKAFVESARVSSDFTAGYAQALSLASGLARTNPDASRLILRALINAQPERPVARELLERLGDRK